MTGAERIAAERQRQIDSEGWTPEHDDEHRNESLAFAAAAYAAPITVYRVLSNEAEFSFRDIWPWDAAWDDRPRDEDGDRRYHKDVTVDERIVCLQKAGALCAAEIDRLERTRG